MLNAIMNLFTYHTKSSKETSETPNSEPKKSGSSAKEDNGYYVWNKGENPAFSPYFSGKEFACKCNFPDCKVQRISKTMIVRLDLMRKEAKQPLIITSAYRCSKYQEFLKSAKVSTIVAKKSTHELGDAVDVVPQDRNIETFLKLAEKHFDSIGTAKTFLHLDLRVGKRRWVY